MGSMQEKTALGFGSLVSGLGVVYKSGRTRELAWRRSQLKGLIRLLTEEEEEIFDVLRDDLGKHRTESFRDEIELLKSTLERFFTKPEDMARIVNEKQFNRLSGLLEDHKVSCCVVHGGDMDPKTLSIEPTILLNPPLDSDIMTEEIFGPLLPIITVKKIQDSIEYMNSKPKSLAIYAFTTSEELKERIIKETSSGSVTFNDAIVQYGLESIPFGGVGFGQYHGKYSFEMFSHKKAVLKRSFLIEFMFRYPPWDDSKLRMLQHVFHYDYVSLFLALLGLRR